MAIFIFSKNSNNQLSSLYRIASSQSVYDANKNWQDDLYDLITVEDTNYNSVKLGTKYVVSKNENEVVYENCIIQFINKKQLTDYINSIIPIFEMWIISNNLKPFASTVTTYLNYIKSIDISSLSITEETPLNSSLESYVENQGITAVHPLELL
jgi:hypothetical protein